MPSVLEQAEQSANEPQHDNYMGSVNAILEKQRRGELQLWEVPDPFEQVFPMNEERSRQGFVVWNLPGVSQYDPPQYAIEFTFEPNRIARFLHRTAHSLQITNTQGDLVLDLLNPKPHSILFDPDGRFEASYHSKQVLLSWLDSYAAMYSLGHELTHITDELFENNAALWRGVLKYHVYDMGIRSNVGITFLDNRDPTQKIKDNVSFALGGVLKLAQITVDQLLNDPLTQDEALFLVQSEARASEGGIARLAEVFDLLEYPVAHTRPITEQVTKYAVDGLSLYVQFARNQTGGNFYDWLESKRNT